MVVYAVELSDWAERGKGEISQAPGHIETIVGVSEQDAQLSTSRWGWFARSRSDHVRVRHWQLYSDESVSTALGRQLTLASHHHLIFFQPKPVSNHEDVQPPLWTPSLSLPKQWHAILA